IELSINGNPDRASELFERALAAARELGDPWILARTLLQAGWAPYWRNDLATARPMFQEALEVARTNPAGDRWAEARALVMLAAVAQESEDEEAAFALASESLAVAEAAGDRFAIAVAREAVGSALRRLGRLEEAEPHLDAAVEAFRDLGARWELASALTSRGIAHRLAGRAEPAVKDLREAFRLCRELKERSIVTWSAESLAVALVDAGDPKAARRVVEEVADIASSEGPAWRDRLLGAESAILLAEGDREAARERAVELLARARERGVPKEVAARVWWVGRLFGPDAVGGEQELARARTMLEALHWEQALREPELVQR